MRLKCDISKCSANCCCNVPIPKGYFTALKNRIVRPIIRFEDAGNNPELGGNNVVAITNEDIQKTDARSSVTIISVTYTTADRRYAASSERVSTSICNADFCSSIRLERCSQ